jgi:hypothetical protein
MFSAEQYRAKAAEFRALLMNIPRSSNEASELRNLEQTYATLAENEEWMAINIDKTVQRRKNGDNHGRWTDYALIRFDAGLVGAYSPL